MTNPQDREIKFRAWDKEEKVFTQPLTLRELWLDGIDTEYGAGSIFDTTGGFPVAKIENYIFMQYTGLKDKNGKEVYEGDIVTLNGSITGAEGLSPGFLFTEEDMAEIAWDDSIAAWSVAGDLDRTDRVEVTYRNHVIQLIQQGACEVIGNIYENKDLLK